MLDSGALDRINTSRRQPVLWFASAAAAGVCLLGNLGAIGLVGPDEPRYAWIARAMAETGDWVTPRLYGQPWFEKPVLYYWLAALGFLSHLPPEWAARLPSALSGLVLALTLGWLARKYCARNLDSLSSPVVVAPLVFASTVAAVGFSRSASPDMLLSVSLTLAMASAAEVLERTGGLRARLPVARTHQAAPLALFGFFLALGTLAKGPVAIALAGGAIGLWALSTKQWRMAFRLAHPIAVVAFSVMALPWYVLCSLRNPDFLRVFILEHNFERYLTPMFEHREPFWFFLPVLLIALGPWTALLWPTAREGLALWRRKSWSHSPGWFFACWAVFPVLFFSFSQSKLPGYVLPVMGPLALLCTVAGTRATEKSLSTRLVFAGTGAIWLLLGTALWRAILRERIASSGTAILAFALVTAAVLVGVGLLGRFPLMVASCLCVVAITIETASLTIVRQVEPFLSARPHALFMRNDQHPERIFTYQLRRSWNYGLAFYFHRELPEWSPDDREAALVLTTPNGLAEIRKLGRFHGSLDEPYVGVLYVPVERVPR
jgi:4-amino-4-deoxy-L-arabinose transferase-like glycosyltransferase